MGPLPSELLCWKEGIFVLETSPDIVWRNMEEELHALCQEAGGIPCERAAGVIGYSLLDLRTGKTAGFREDVLFPTASTIKIAVLLGLTTRVHRKELSWEQRFSVGPENKVGGSGILSLLKHQVDLSLWDLASLMIALSDNHATNICIDLAGMSLVNDLLDGLGLTRTRLRRKMMDLEAVKRGNENVATPHELTLLLEKLYRAQGIPTAVAADVLKILELPKSGPFADALPPDVRRANKTGGLSRVRVDAGVIYLPGRDFCLAVMGSFLIEGEKDDQPVTEVVASAYRHMALLADCNELGRPVAF
jgi:beta-lactamase class A